MSYNKQTIKLSGTNKTVRIAYKEYDFFVLCSSEQKLHLSLWLLTFQV